MIIHITQENSILYVNDSLYKKKLQPKLNRNLHQKSVDINIYHF
jgi:hypothetical protein